MKLKHKNAITPPTTPPMIAVKVTTALTRGATSVGALLGVAAILVSSIVGVDTVTGEPVTKAKAVSRTLL